MKTGKEHDMTHDIWRQLSGLFVLALIILLGAAGICSGATTSGILPGDETWSGDVVITGTVMIPGDITLGIEPGTTVEFAAGREIELIVKGTLTAEGTESDPITFTSDAENPAKWDWTWIRLDGSGGSGSSLKHCVIEYANTGIRIKESSPVIESNLFSSSCYGINASSSSSLIKGNVFYNNDYGISADNCDFTLTGNRFYKSVQDAIDVSGEFFATIDHNLIYQNGGHGIQVEGLSGTVIVNNTIDRNGLDGIHIRHALSRITIKNNILSANGRNGISCYDSPLPAICYNDLWNNGSHNYFNYTSGEAFIPDPSTGEISKEPLFTDAENGDYTLRCSSACIDAGDPDDDWSSEPEPNGSRINMGAYGGTPEAARRLSSLERIFHPLFFR